MRGLSTRKKFLHGPSTNVHTVQSNSQRVPNIRISRYVAMGYLDK